MSDTIESADNGAVEEIDTNTAENTENEAKESSDSGPDFKAHSRKWESRAKANLARVQELEAKLAAKESGADDTAQRVAALEAQLRESQSRVLRADISQEFELGEWADLLTGDTEEDMRDSAERIRARIDNLKAPRAPKPDASQGAAPVSGADPAQSFASAFKPLDF